MDGPQRKPPSARAAQKQPRDGSPSATDAARGSSVSFGRGCVRLGEREVPLYAGALHYFQLDPAYWRPALEAMADMGLRMVETYAPWNVHEIAANRFDFGRLDPRKDLGRFLDLAQELDLLAFVRPGPHINAELTYFGLPERIIYDAGCQARSPQGGPVHFFAPPKMFPVPSYASRRFQAAVRGWYAAVAEVLVPRLWPKGPVVLLQVDNEAALYFRDGPYAQDYHPDALADYRAFIRGRYGSLSRLRAAYGHGVNRWAAVAPPTHFSASAPVDLTPHLDWMVFHQKMICDAIQTWSAQLRAVGLTGVPLVHNLPLGESLAPAGLGALEGVVDLVGIDYHHLRRDLPEIKRRTLVLAGSTDLPFAPELGAGAPPWLPPRSHEDSVHMALCALAHGLRGFNLYMAVERDRWCGAPISADGTPRSEVRVWHKLLEALHRTRFHALQRKAVVGLMVPREYAHLSRATYAMAGLGPTLFEATFGPPTAACLQQDLGFDHTIQTEWWDGIGRYARALDRAGVPYVYVDSEAEDHHLDGLRLIFSPCFDFVGKPRWHKLTRWAADGGIVILGPVLPSLDASMQPFAPSLTEGMRLLQAPDGDSALRIVLGLVEELSLPRPFPASQPAVWTAVHEDDDGPRMLFVTQPEARPVLAHIKLPMPLRFTDPLTKEVFEGHATLTIGLEPNSCRMLVVDRPDDAPPAQLDDAGNAADCTRAEP